MKQFFRNPFTELFFVLFVAVLATIIFTYPSVFRMSKAFIGDGGDNYEYASYMGLAAQRIQNGEFPLSPTTFWRYPVGVDFQRAFDSYLTLVIGTFFTLLVDLPKSYNITVFILMILNGVFSYLYFQKLTKSVFLGILGMTIYGFSWYALAKANAHLNLLSIGSFPLFLYMLMRTYEKRRLGFFDFFLSFLPFLYASISSMQYTVMLLIFVFILGTSSFIFYRNEFLSFLKKALTNIRSAIFAAFSVFAIFLILFAPHITSFISGSFQFFGREGTLYAATPGLDNFVLPNKYLDLLISFFGTSSSRTSIESMVFVGWIELFLFLLFFTARQIPKKFKAFVAVLFLIPLLLAFGFGKENNFFLLPYRFLSHLPIFAVIAEPGRYFTLFYLVMTSAILIYLKTLPKRIFTIAFCIVLILVVIERLPKSIHTVPTLQNDPYVGVVKKEKDSAVLDLPINPFYPRYNVLSLYYQKPITNGYFHWSADGDKEKSFLYNPLLRRYTCGDEKVRTDDSFYLLEEQNDRALLSLLKSHDIRTIVVHKDDKFFHPVCKNIRIRLSRLAPYISEAKETEKQVQLEAQAWTGKPSFSVYFPKNGTFFLDGLYIAPSNAAAFFITLDQVPVQIPYSWEILKNSAMIFHPRNTISLEVKAGSLITVKTFADVDNTWFSLWYRYTPSENATEVPYQTSFEKIFEDDAAVVYRIQ